MSHSRPELAKIAARILIPQNGWAIGTFHVPRDKGFEAFLNEAGPFYKLTNVTMPNHLETIDFFALRADEVAIVVPLVEEAKLALEPAGPRVHMVACWLHTGELVGTLAVDSELRVSDYLMQHRGFATLRNCAGRDKHAVVNGSAVAFVNARWVLGVVERSPS